MSTEHTTLSLEEIEALAAKSLSAQGCDEANAAAVARTITAAERDGCHAHGLMRLPGYVAALASGKVNGAAQPGAQTISPAVVQVDGDRGFAPLALERGIPSLAERAHDTGIAAMALVNTHHFAALWYEVEMVAEHGLCAMACTSYKPAVLPAGGGKALYGTNPFAFAWPRKGARPVVFDQASAVVARGEVMLAAREGHELPEGVGVDEHGRATTDPEAILKGALNAFGGYKGASIAMMVELLAGALIGECFSFEAAERDNNDGGPPRGGEFILAIDPASFGDPEGWQAHGERLFTAILSQSGTRLPGDRRYQNRQGSGQSGVEVSVALLDEVRKLSD